MKIIFFGASDFSKPVFEALRKGSYSPILWSLENSFENFKKMNPDVCVVAAYGRIIPEEYLKVPKFGFLNIHPSLLPKYRGPSPIQTAILNGDKETGITIILMDEKIDHGPTIRNGKLKMKNEKYKELEKELAELGGKLLVEILPEWIKGGIKPTGQNHNEATYTKKFTLSDGKIDWSKPAKEIERQIRALNPEPGTWTLWKNKTLKILDAGVIETNLNKEIGKVLSIENQIIVKCGQGALLFKELQLEGRNKMTAADFVRGRPDFISSILD